MPRLACRNSIVLIAGIKRNLYLSCELEPDQEGHGFSRAIRNCMELRL
jgi:hypothetical protein